MNRKKIESKIISLPKIHDYRGNLSFLQNLDQIPFEIKRVYWIYDVPSGECRGGHAYYQLEEVIIALTGSFDISVNNGSVKITYQLNASNKACYIPNLYWRQIENFSTNAMALIIASKEFDKDDYIYNHNDFIKAINAK